jgi:D-glycero-alpha-D-manno-heptose-7-phosphate kinase
LIIARAPHRISLGGGGTDLPSYYERHGGLIIAAGIDKYVYIYVNQPAADDLIRVKYSRYEEVTSPQDVVHDLVRPTLQVLGINSGIEIVSMADIPAGSGMGSSGAFIVSTLTALLEMQRKRTPPHAIAELACHIEIDLAEHPVGKQDQYMAAFGGLTKLEISPTGKTEVTTLDISADVSEELQSRLLLYFTGKIRDANGILGEQSSELRSNMHMAVEGLHRTKELGYKIMDALESGDLEKFGSLLNEHWETKKQRSTSVTDSQIDRWYSCAMAAGAKGGKIIGAGNGGFLLLYAPPDAKLAVRNAMTEEGLREVTYRFEFDGAKVISNV